VAKGHTHLTVVADLDRGQVLYLAEGRKGESLDGFGEGLGSAGRRGIEAIAMDMEPCIQSTCRHVPGAEEKIVPGKFHIVEHLHEAVGKVRRAEQRARFRELCASDLGVARAWALKERFRLFT
jgi:transposase